jgi:hypothetical protein
MACTPKLQVTIAHQVLMIDGRNCSFHLLLKGSDIAYINGDITTGCEGSKLLPCVSEGRCA